MRPRRPRRARPAYVTRAPRFHDLDNLFACDGSVFPMSSGFDPTMTIIAVAAKTADGIAGTAPRIA